jgi:hypothetical protein
MLDLTLNLTYGARAGGFDDALTNNLLDSLYAITSVRRSTAEYRHFVSLLWVVPERSNSVLEAVKECQRCIVRLIFILIFSFLLRELGVQEQFGTWHNSFVSWELGSSAPQLPLQNRKIPY